MNVWVHPWVGFLAAMQNVPTSGAVIRRCWRESWVVQGESDVRSDMRRIRDNQWATGTTGLLQSEVLALKRKSRILGQWSYPVSGSRKSQDSSHFSVGQTAQSLTCSIMEKPHTGLDECPRILLSCFRARNSVANCSRHAFVLFETAQAAQRVLSCKGGNVVLGDHSLNVHRCTKTMVRKREGTSKWQGRRQEMPFSLLNKSMLISALLSMQVLHGTLRDAGIRSSGWHVLIILCLCLYASATAAWQHECYSAMKILPCVNVYRLKRKFVTNCVR